MTKQSRTPHATTGEHPTKRRLIEETTRRIMEDGFEAVNVDEVLAAVGVTKGSLYHHFGSVDNLMIAGLLHAFEASVRESEGWAVALRDECGSARDVRDRLHGIVDTLNMPERRTIRSVRLHALSMARTQPELAEEVKRLQVELTDSQTEVIRELQSRGWMRSGRNPRALAVLFQAVNLGLIVDDVVDDEHRAQDDAWSALHKDVVDRYLCVHDVD